MLNELGLGGVPIHESLQHNTTIVHALTMAAKPKPKVQDGNDDAAGAAALSLIIGGDLDTCYGPELLTAEIVYYGKFKKNYAPEWSDEGESESSDEVE
ncbi:hypothetical protein Ctob_012847 [Chrysochromulina tobinii]|uniref:Uncharacterized protein n=1 Tax=Chrysochromulina tobinii TaxID=1460289 RepID=A0A0M0JZT5_9EUKA|nr:hypothetical protein Ctob_012847 [Chrysochromulina tobinii]|eukprot:KOO31847.1 hypothetical protein Ctob_012847 [Chrysochromulina sp. CCMP291]